MTSEEEALPPPPPASATGIRSILVSIHDWSSSDEGKLALSVLAYIISLGLLYYAWNDDPVFQVQSVSISVNSSHGSIQPAIAEWDLGLTIENTNSLWKLKFEDIHVLVQCGSLGWSGAVVAPFVQGTKNTTLINAKIIALLPFDNGLSPRATVRGLLLDFQVLFRARLDGYRAQSLCNDMRAVFSENATKGILVGGPKLCN